MVVWTMKTILGWFQKEARPALRGGQSHSCSILLKHLLPFASVLKNLKEAVFETSAPVCLLEEMSRHSQLWCV